MTETQSTERKTPEINIAKIYLTKSSWQAFEPSSAFTTSKQPSIEIGLHVGVTQQPDAAFEVCLDIDLTCKDKSDKKVFTVKVSQAGLFQLQNCNQKEEDSILRVTCPNTLLPYARETIDSLVVKGGFQPVMLAQINFEAVYAQSKVQVNKSKAPSRSDRTIH